MTTQAKTHPTKSPATNDKPDQDVELADNLGKSRRGGLVDDVELADNLGKSRRGGLADDELLATSGKRGGLVGDDTELA